MVEYLVGAGTGIALAIGRYGGAVIGALRSVKTGLADCMSGIVKGTVGPDVIRGIRFTVQALVTIMDLMQIRCRNVYLSSVGVALDFGIQEEKKVKNAFLY